MKRILCYVLITGLVGCAGGGVTSGGSSASADQFKSEAPVQFLPYEVVRNNLITGLQVSASSQCITALDKQADIFGAADTSGNRFLGFSLIRQKAVIQLADTCCREAIQKNGSKLLDSAKPLNMDKLGYAIFGRPLTAYNESTVTSIVNLTGYTSNAQRQHAVCVSFLSSFEANVQ